MAELSCEGRSVRDINAQMRNLFADGEDVVVTSPGARHNLGVALLKPGTVSFDGSVGYYCGGLSDGATIRVKGSAGWGLAESMLNGEVTAEGNAGNSAGAAMRGGAVVIHGDSGARTGVSMKGGLIVVGGNCGYMSGFMGQKGTMIICGDAGEGFADSMYETVCFVGGEIRELGNDTVVSELSEEDIQLLGGALDRYLPQRIRSGVPEPGKFRKVVDSGRFEPWDRYDTLKKPCYDLRALHRNLDLMTTIIGYMQEMGWGPYANDHEDANCQFEINWHYSDALTTADRNTFFKWMVRTVAEKNGLWATLMPKPFGHLTGNGTHYHMSLADVTSGENLFLDESDDLGLSPRARWFMGGILEHAGALAAVTSPIVNSYKRLIRSEPHSGATWAPVYVTYGPSNRTQMIRVPDRAESRTAPRTAPRTPTSLVPSPWPPASTASSDSSTPAQPTTRTYTPSPRPSLTTGESVFCRLR